MLIAVPDMPDNPDDLVTSPANPADSASPLPLTGPLRVLVRNGTLKRGYTLPVLLLTLLDASGAIDFSSVTITEAQFVLVHVETGDALVGGALETVSAALGQFRYRWQSGDTGVAGNYLGEVQLTFSDGSVASWPDDGYFLVEILRDLVV